MSVYFYISAGLQIGISQTYIEGPEFMNPNYQSCHKKFSASEKVKLEEKWDQNV
jgi:hypothetical protein